MLINLKTRQQAAVSSYSMSEPPQVVIDLMDVSFAASLKDLEGDGDLISRVEGKYDDGQGTTRVRPYLSVHSTLLIIR